MLFKKKKHEWQVYVAFNKKYGWMDWLSKKNINVKLKNHKILGGGSLALKIDLKKMILHAHAQKNSQILKKKKKKI